MSWRRPYWPNGEDGPEEHSFSDPDVGVDIGERVPHHHYYPYSRHHRHHHHHDDICATTCTPPCPSTCHTPPPPCEADVFPWVLLLLLLICCSLISIYCSAFIRRCCQCNRKRDWSAGGDDPCVMCGRSCIVMGPQTRLKTEALPTVRKSAISKSSRRELPTMNAVVFDSAGYESAESAQAPHAKVHKLHTRNNVVTTGQRDTWYKQSASKGEVLPYSCEVGGAWGDGQRGVESSRISEWKETLKIPTAESPSSGYLEGAPVRTKPCRSRKSMHWLNTSDADVFGKTRKRSGRKMER